MPGPISSSCISTAIRAAVAPTLARIIASDRGSVRERNHGTAISRADHFIRWCHRRNFSDTSFSFTNPQEAGEILAAYAQEIAEGHGIKKTQHPDVKTIQGYVRAAGGLAIAAGLDDPRFLPHATNKDGKRLYVPLLQRVFETADKWTPSSRPERQSITVAILSDLRRRVGSAPGAELLLAATIRDAAILGVFTGSRVSEYAQGQLPAGQRFQCVPINAASGAQGNHPISFEDEDFTFYSSAGIQTLSSVSHPAKYLRVRFRYTKGTARAFTYRMFASIPSSALCPIAAASRVKLRWQTLSPGLHTPIFCYLPSMLTRKPFFLLDRHMTIALRASLVRVYPNPRHILRQHASSVSSHSLRVFACLCLKTAGWDEESISHQLRWNSDTVKFYIRQSLVQVDSVSSTVFCSALTEDLPGQPKVIP